MGGAMHLFRLVLCVLPLFGLARLPAKEAVVAEDWLGRYLPFSRQADIPAAVMVQTARTLDRPPYWRSAAAIHATRRAGAAPLAGLRVALDPGHIGGDWASVEAREFRIAEGDFALREGELVLDVAQRVRDRLEALGADVDLLREANRPVAAKTAADFLEEAAADLDMPQHGGLPALVDYGRAIRERAAYLAAVPAELAARCRKVNELLQPDVLVSLHIDAAPWPRVSGRPVRELVDVNRTHVLIFGCLSEAELAEADQASQMLHKLFNGSGPEEHALGRAMAAALAKETGLPPVHYGGSNAVPMAGSDGYLWARNLVLLRGVRCPVVLLEPFMANSREIYPRLQAGLAKRAAGEAPGSEDLLVRYAEAVVAGLMAHYGPPE